MAALCELFLGLADMSVTASFVILAVLVLRLAMRPLPRRYSYLLWAAAGFRLACPVSFASALSFFNLPVFRLPGAQAVTQLSQSPALAGEEAAAAVQVERTAALSAGTVTQAAANGDLQSGLSRLEGLSCVWLAGVVILGLYSLVSWLLLRRRLAVAVRDEGNVWLSDRVRTPFILGIVRPRIYLPFGLEEPARTYVLAHERHHIRRGDHIIKLLAFGLLAAHWFNPLVWAAFTLMSRDMEMSCDEFVLKQQGTEGSGYAMTLLSFAANRRFPKPSPLSFGESDVKRRIKNAMKWKKPSLWLTIAGAIICAVLTGCFIADPPSEQTAESGQTTTQEYIDALVDENESLRTSNTNLYQVIADLEQEILYYTSMVEEAQQSWENTNTHVYFYASNGDDVARLSENEAFCYLELTGIGDMVHIPVQIQTSSRKIQVENLGKSDVLVLLCREAEGGSVVSSNSVLAGETVCFEDLSQAQSYYLSVRVDTNGPLTLRVSDGETQIAGVSLPDQDTAASYAYNVQLLEQYRDELADMIYSMLELHEAPTCHVPQIHGGSYSWGDIPYVAFQTATSSSGLDMVILPCGLLYSPNDEPLPVYAGENIEEAVETVELVADGLGWRYETAGGETGYVQRIEENWFFYDVTG